MATVFKLPLLGQTMQEGTILKWHKQEGDRVEGWETLLEVETDKVNMEVDPQVSGVLRKILAPEGATVPVGAPIAIIGAPGESIEELLTGLGDGPISDFGSRISGLEADPSGSSPPNPKSEIRNPKSPEAETISIGGNGEPPAVSPRAREAARSAELDWKALQIPGSGFEGMIVERDVQAFLAQAGTESARITPLAARIAADEGLSLGAIPGTGPGGKITAEDVRRAIEIRAHAGAGQVAPLPASARAEQVPPRPAAVETVQLTGMRKRIAERLGEIWRAAPHVPLRAEIDVTELVRLREQLLPEVERRAGARLTYTHLLAAALCRALPEFPAVNGTLEGETLTHHREVHLGVAMALEQGLLVPVVRSAEALTLLDLVRRIGELAEAARTGRLRPEQVSGGTFTLTNLGQYGIDSFDPVLNPPQVAILGTGRIVPRFLPINGQPVVRQMLSATLVFDHRALDGAPAAQFLARLRDLLENPTRLLL